jgi:hypothetical protein
MVEAIGRPQCVRRRASQITLGDVEHYLGQLRNH